MAEAKKIYTMENNLLCDSDNENKRRPLPNCDRNSWPTAVKVMTLGDIGALRGYVAPLPGSLNYCSGKPSLGQGPWLVPLKKVLAAPC